MSKTKRRSSKIKIAAKAIQYWQNKTGSHEIDYDAVQELIKREKILDDLQPISVEAQIHTLLHRAVSTEMFTTKRGRRVRKYGIPRYIVEGEIVTLPPVDMRYTTPEIAKVIFDANYEHGVNALKRVAIEEDEYRQYSLFDAKEVDRSLPERNWNIEAEINEARATGIYDDSFDPDSLNE